MKIFVKTFGPVLVFFLALAIGFNVGLLPDLIAKFDLWAAESERSSATILAQSIANDMVEGRRAAAIATIGQVWANRPDWGLVEAFDADGTRFYPANAPAPLEGLRSVSVRISKGRAHLGQLVVHFDGSTRLQTIRDAVAEFRSWVIGLGGALLAISLLLHFIFVTRRVAKLRERFRDTALTDPAAPRGPLANDEIGDLWRSFEDLRLQLRNRESLRAQASARAEEESRTNLALRLKAEEANKIKSDFIAMLSHELRTPMNAIVGMASIVSQRPLDDELRQEIGAIEQSAQHLTSLINQILDFSRLEADAVAIEALPFDLHALLDDMMRIANALPRSPALALRQRADPGLPRLLSGDPGRITQVLLNLVGNAIKFTAQGHVELSVDGQKAPDGAWRLCFTVEDTGKGVPRAMQEKIFEPFAQVSRFSGGTGLGLPICRRYARLMGGELTMESEEGRGSIFRFRLPLREGVATPIGQKPEPGKTTGTVPALRILVAEDTPVSATVIRLMLQRLGHSVRVTGDGREAVQAFAAEHFDLVFLDIQMPVMDGLEAAREIRRHARGATLPIVALSALATDADRETARRSGISAYLAKPIRSADVETLIAGLAIRPGAPDAREDPSRVRS